MLHPYNILYPTQHQTVESDPYFKAFKKYLGATEEIIVANRANVKQGRIIIPCHIVDIDDDNFMFADRDDINISSIVSQVSFNGEWVLSDLEDSISKEHDFYQMVNDIVFVVCKAEPIIYHSTVTGDLSADGVFFLQSTSEKIATISNLVLQSSISFEEKIVEIQDNIVTTDKRIIKLNHIDMFHYSVDDVVVKGVFFDPVATVSNSDGYIEISLPSDKMYLKEHLNFQTNIYFKEV